MGSWSAMCISRLACLCDESASITLALLCMSTVAVVEKRAARVEIVGHVVKPEQLSPTSVQPRAFKVPAGFSMSVFAEGLGKPRMLEVSDDTRPASSTIFQKVVSTRTEQRRARRVSAHRSARAVTRVRVGE
jgi:hypothetical protein